MTAAVTIRERSILFSGPMVRAILDGRKTQTRRVVRLPDTYGTPADGHARAAFDRMQPGYRDGSTRAVFDYDGEANAFGVRCPYGQPGDRLWVREAHHILDARPEVLDEERASAPREPWSAYVVYDRECGEDVLVQNIAPEEWRDSFDNDHVVWRPSIFMPRWASRLTLEITDVRVERVQAISEDDAIAEGCFDEKEHDGSLPSQVYGQLWDSLNAKRGFGWDANPWVWVIAFRRAI